MIKEYQDEKKKGNIYHALTAITNAVPTPTFKIIASLDTPAIVKGFISP